MGSFPKTSSSKFSIKMQTNAISLAVLRRHINKSSSGTIVRGINSSINPNRQSTLSLAYRQLDNICSTTGVRRISSNSMTVDEAREKNGTLRMNLFTAVNEGMRQAMKTDDTAVSGGEGGGRGEGSGGVGGGDGRGGGGGGAACIRRLPLNLFSSFTHPQAPPPPPHPHPTQTHR